MNIEVRTDNHIEGTARMIEHVSAQLKSEFSRYSEKVTHIEVHFSDENGEKGGDKDKRCALEARAAGFKPMAVTHKAPSIDLSLDGAIEKLHRMFEHSLDKKSEHRHETRPNWEELVEE